MTGLGCLPKMPPCFLGTVLAVQANFYQVRIDAWADLPEGMLPPEFPARWLLCTRRTRLKKVGQRVMVGDRVRVEEADWLGERGAISAVLPRETMLDRPPVANADRLLLVFAIAQPALDPNQLSRFLVKAEATGITVQLCLSKCDLVSEADRQAWCDRLTAWGYTPIAISVETGLGIDALHAGLSGHTTIVSGPSGVGKSSLINALIPEVHLRVAKVSGKLQRGRHTTRHVELFELTEGGLLADTPGFNQPELDCEPEQLMGYFPEIRQAIAEGNCQFSDCRHREEPNCVVRYQDWERYDLYLEMLVEAEAIAEAREREHHQGDKFKSKTGRDGQQEYEPKLDRHKYRRVSRRQQHQNLQDLCAELEAAEAIEQAENSPLPEPFS
jgi:ribosome biogenesis GTPase